MMDWIIFGKRYRHGNYMSGLCREEEKRVDRKIQSNMKGGKGLNPRLSVYESEIVATRSSSSSFKKSNNDYYFNLNIILGM